MAKLPKGYLDMAREDYEAMPLDTLRAVYVKVREIAAYFMGQEGATEAARAFHPITGVEWIEAMFRVKCRCERCGGTGVFHWGAVINGSPSHSAPCARCAGKGTMDFDDMRRSKAYDAYAIVKACRG